MSDPFIFLASQSPRRAQLLGQLGNFLGVGSLVSLAIVLSALPGFLYLADPLIIKKKKQPKEA